MSREEGKELREGESSLNQDIADQLALIGSYYEAEGNIYRARAYNEAAERIAKYPRVITSGTEARMNIRGVGESISADIDEYLLTGSMRRLRDLEEKNKERFDTLQLFSGIFGIDMKIANKFYNEGYRTLEDLWFKAPLTPAQKIGILYRKHLVLRIPREEMDRINNRITEILYSLDPNLKFVIAGSYRRGEASSGDIDLLVQGNGHILEEIVEALDKSGILVAKLAKGRSQYMGILRLGPDFNAHRIDILLIPKESWATGLMHFTGSKMFNILIRRRARELGLKLNQYGLFEIDTHSQIPVKTEEGIFQILGIKYLSPEERTPNLSSLPMISESEETSN